MNLSEVTSKIISAIECETDFCGIKLTSSSKLVVIRFIEMFHSEPEKPVAVTQGEMAESVGMDYKAVGVILRQLVDEGIISAVKTGNRWDYYGVNAFKLIDYLGEVYMFDGLHCKESLPVPEASVGEVSTEGVYYVYVCRLKGEPVYVGKGKHGRMSHCLSGTSSNANLNRLVFEHGEDQFEVDKVIEGVSEEYALLKEREIIDSLFTLGYNLCNKVGGTK